MKPESKTGTAKPRRNRKRLVIVITAILLVLFICACLVAKLGYDSAFQRGGSSKHSIYLRYPDTDNLSRRAVDFMSGQNRLQGYVYGEENDKGLMVISHGLGGSAEGYFSETLWFVRHGWRVLAFDNTGSGESEGKNTHGISQSLLDLRAALDYVAINEALADLPLVLFGHSWGGYAVTAILNDGYPVKAAVSVAGFSTPKEALYDFAESRTGVFGTLAFPLLWGYHNLLFGQQANISAIDGINTSKVPVMVIHGTADGTLRYDGCGIIAHQAQITSPNVVYITRDAAGQNGHSNLMGSAAALAYAGQARAQWAALEEAFGGTVPADEATRFYAQADKALASELDAGLFNEIGQFLDDAVR